MNSSDYLNLVRCPIDFHEIFANDMPFESNDILIFESYAKLPLFYEDQLYKINVEGASSVEKTWDEKNITVVKQEEHLVDEDVFFKSLPLEICKEIFAKLNEKDTNSALFVDVNWNKINLTVVKDQEFSKIANFLSVLLNDLDEKYPIQKQQFNDLIKLSLTLSPYNKPLTCSEIKIEIELLKKELKEILLSLPFDELDKFVDSIEVKNPKLFNLLLDATLSKLVKEKLEGNQIDKLLKKGYIPTEETLNSIIESGYWIFNDTKHDLIKATLKAGVVPLDNILKYAIKFKVYPQTLEAVLNEFFKVGIVPSEDILDYAIENRATARIMEVLLGAGIISTEKLNNDLDALVKGEFKSDQIDKLLKKGAIPTEETLNSIIESKFWISDDTKSDLIKATLKDSFVPLDNILEYAIKFKVNLPTLEAVLKEFFKAEIFSLEDILDYPIENRATARIMELLLGAGIISTEKISNDLDALVKGEFKSNQIDKLLEKGAIPTEEALNSIIESKFWISTDTIRDLIKATLKAGVVPLDNILRYAIKFNVHLPIPTLAAILNEMSKVGIVPSEDTLKLAIQAEGCSTLKFLLEEMAKLGLVPSGEVLEFALEKESYILVIEALLGAGVIPTEKALILANKSSRYNDMFKKYTK